MQTWSMPSSQLKSRTSSRFYLVGGLLPRPIRSMICCGKSMRIAITMTMSAPFQMGPSARPISMPWRFGPMIMRRPALRACRASLPWSTRWSKMNTIWPASLLRLQKMPSSSWPSIRVRGWNSSMSLFSIWTRLLTVRINRGQLFSVVKKGLALNMLRTCRLRQRIRLLQNPFACRSKRLATNGTWKKQNWPRFQSRCVFFMSPWHGPSSSSIWLEKAVRTNCVIPIGGPVAMASWIRRNEKHGPLIRTGSLPFKMCLLRILWPMTRVLWQTKTWHQISWNH